jgi:hypothetical protein
MGNEHEMEEIASKDHYIQLTQVLQSCDKKLLKSIGRVVERG